MKNIIKELYYGNIDPQARGFKNGSYLKKQMTIISENEALLTDKLTGDEKKAFLALARFAYDTFVDNSSPYCDFLKEEFE